VKTIAQGMPVDRQHLWYLPPAFFVAGGPWVRPSPGIPCALSILEGARRPVRLGRHPPRECELTSHCFDAPMLRCAITREHPFADLVVD
jgi:hypothetical protein